jgi:hypothetical protein
MSPESSNNSSKGTKIITCQYQEAHNTKHEKDNADMCTSTCSLCVGAVTPEIRGPRPPRSPATNNFTQHPIAGFKLMLAAMKLFHACQFVGDICNYGPRGSVVG